MPCRIPEKKDAMKPLWLMASCICAAGTHTFTHTPQSVQKTLHTVGRLLFQHLDAALHLPDTKTTQGVRQRSAASELPHLLLINGTSNDSKQGHPQIYLGPGKVQWAGPRIPFMYIKTQDCSHINILCNVFLMKRVALTLFIYLAT